METSKKKRSCGGAFHKDRREMCKAARSAKARKSACDEQNKETIKRERDVTTPRAFHKLLGNFLAISRTFEKLLELSSNSETSEQLLVLQIGPKPLMKLFLSHAVYNGIEICYCDFIHKVKIDLLKEKLLNTPSPPPNEAASISLKGQVAQSSRRSVAPVQWSLSVLCQKSENTESCSNHLHHSM